MAEMDRDKEQYLLRGKLPGLRPLTQSLLLLAAACFAMAATGTRPPSPTSSDALVTTYTFNFDTDLDNDAQPDFWTRLFDRRHPQYVEARLDFDNAQSGAGALQIEAGGASAVFLSPPVQIEGSAAYDVTCYLKTVGIPASGMRSTCAYMEALLYRKDGSELAAVRTFPEATATTDWQLVAAVDVSRKYPDAAFLRVAAVLDGLALTGTAWFDSVTVTKRPVAFARTNRPGNCFYCSDKKVFSFEVNGLPQRRFQFDLAVRNVDGLEVNRVSLNADVTEDGTASIAYTLPALEPGPYSLAVDLLSGADTVLSQKVRIGVLPDYASLESAKNFGLDLSSVPKGASREYALTALSGVGWVKLPLTGAGTTEKVQYLQLVGELRRVGITPVGILTVPEDASIGAEGGEPGAPNRLLALLAAGSDAWMAAFGDTVNTFAGSVQWWQLGAEDDSAVSRSPDALAALADINKFINALSYQARLGVPADRVRPSSDFAPSQPGFQSVSAAAVGDGTPVVPPAAPGATELWLWTDPARWLEGGPDKAAANVAAGVGTMFASGAKVIFLRDPWKSVGIVDGEGNVTPFALVLANVIHTLANYQYSGAIAFPNGTPNAVFASSDNTRVLLWPAAQPKEERIFLGDSVEKVDVYGRRTPAPIVDGENSILVTGAPMILDRVDTSVVETRKTFAIDPDVVDSIYEVQPIYVSFTNRFQTQIMGELTMKFPPGWEANPSVFFVRLKPGEAFRGRANLVVPYNALAGTQEITATLYLGDLGSERITVVERKQLSSRSFKMDIEMRPSGSGLLVYQKVTNVSSQPASVSAFLEGEGLERVERLPRRLEPNSSATFSYVLGDAAAWNGKTLRASVREVKTNRFLNQEFVISPAAK